jgi:hypothetical protein
MMKNLYLLLGRELGLLVLELELVLSLSLKLSQEHS